MVESLRLLVGKLHHLASTIGEAFVHWRSTPIRRLSPLRAVPRLAPTSSILRNPKPIGRRSCERPGEVFKERPVSERHDPFQTPTRGFVLDVGATTSGWNECVGDTMTRV